MFLQIKSSSGKTFPSRAAALVSRLVTISFRTAVRVIAGVLLGLANGPSYAAGDVVPPAASLCSNASTPTIDVGSTPATPGRWWNPKRYGTGWDLVFTNDSNSLVAVWYTYDRNGRPTWLTTATNQVDRVNNIWTSPLYRYTWNTSTNTLIYPGTRVGSVAIRFGSSDPTRAGISWQWDEVDQGARSECVFDYFRQGPNPRGGASSAVGASANANATYSGAWYEAQLGGYGVEIGIGQPTDSANSQYIELDALAIYDTTGYPVWVQGQSDRSATAPPQAQYQLSLSYFSSLYPNRVPITDCSTLPSCISPVSGVGTFSRTFTSSTTATAKIDVVAASAALGGNSAISWHRPASQVGTVQLTKLTAADTILVDRLQCTITTGTTCNVSVNWGSQSSAGRAYRRDLATGAMTPLTDDATGQYSANGEHIDALSANQRVQYELRDTGSTGYLYSKSPEVRAYSGVAPDQLVESLSAELPSHDPTVGRIAGQAQVSGGAASYEVPIQIPPGRRGMQPKLSLSYSSRSGNGLIGVGWSLSGLSSVHRCPSTPEQDGVVRPVKLDVNDKLCLDGQRLIPVAATSDTATICPAGKAYTAEYRTEIDSFARITQCGGNLASASTLFKVESKDGEIRFYGETPSFGALNGRVVPFGATTPLSWLLVERRDRVGNNVVFEYQDYGDGETLIHYVDYSGFVNPSTSVASRGTRRVEFAYLARFANGGYNDTSSSYLAGGLTRQTQRLDKVTVWSPNQSGATETVRDYRMGYGRMWNSGRGRLNTLTECAYKNGVASCLPSTSFLWDDWITGFSFDKLDLSQLPTGVAPATTYSGSPVSVASAQPVGDFDGDGAREILASVRNSAGSYDSFLVALGADRSVMGSYQLPAGLAVDIALTPVNADFDSDGRADIVSSVNGYMAIQQWVADAPNTFAGGHFGNPVTTSVPLAGAPSPEIVQFAGDMNGDGKADAVIVRPEPTPTDACYARMYVYLNTTTVGSSTVSFDSGSINWCLKRQTISPGNYVYERFERASDFDGDGLPEIFVTGLTTGSDRALSYVLFGSRDPAVSGTCTPSSQGYKLCSRGFASLFVGDASGADPITAEEKDTRLFSLWIDLNGDGLDDFLYAGAADPNLKNPADGTPNCRFSVCWTLRLNTGTGLGPRIQTASNLGLERALVQSGSFFRPQHASLIQSMDVDGDGRKDLLIPSLSAPFAAMICTHHPKIPPGSEGCPANPPITSSATQSGYFSRDGFTCDTDFYVCPENPRTGDLLGNGVVESVDARLKYDANQDGTQDTYTLNSTAFAGSASTGVEKVYSMYRHGMGGFDSSVYNLSTLRFVQTARNQFLVSERGSSVTGKSNSVGADDVYGDGLADNLLVQRCSVGETAGCAVPVENASGVTYSPMGVPTSLNGFPMFANSAYVSRNLGAGDRTGPGGIVRTDVPPYLPETLIQVSTGLGNESYNFIYFPLASSGDRTGANTQLYQLPSRQSGLRYVDSKHFYFTSSMPVVAEMIQPDGIGGSRMTMYSYREAMYNHQGRGFRGFRTIIEEDLTNLLRSTTIFSQKFPLTGNVEESSVTSMNDPASSTEFISRTKNVWRCNVGDRNDTSCVASTAAPAFPFLDSTDTWTYDPLLASDPSKTWQASPIVHTRTLNAAFEASSLSGYLDTYGNLYAQVTVTDDGGGSLNGVGYDPLVSSQKQVRSTSFTPNAMSWFINKVDNEVVQSLVTYSGNHLLPAGLSAPLTAVKKYYIWNSDRTLLSETVLAGLNTPVEISKSTYTYPPVKYGQVNYGLPDSITATRDGNSSTGRTTSTLYSADGYFPQTVYNAMGRSATALTLPRDGQPYQLTDLNNLITTIDYDAFGRATKTRYRGTADAVQRAPDKNVSINWCRNSSECAGFVANTMFRATEEQDGTPTSVTYLDSLNRPIKSERKLLDGTTQSSEKVYNTRGLLASETAPHRTTEAAVSTTYSGFDVMGRVGAKIEPRQFPVATGGFTGNMKTTYTYTGRKVDIEIRDSNETAACISAPSCRAMYRVADGTGRYLITSDAKQGLTRFWFDANGQSLAIKDANGNVTSATYDDLGRRTAVKDPNMGNWSFVYNGFNELVTQTDARNAQSTFLYDALGRRTQRTSTGADSIGDPSFDTVLDSWVWDAPSAFGQLSTVTRTTTSNTGTLVQSQKTHDYDGLARPIRTRSMVLDAYSNQQNFLEEWLYDSYYGRVKQHNYPSGDKVWLRYSKYGQLNQESDVIGGADYRKVNTINGRGEVTSETLGGIVNSSFFYTATTGQMTQATHAGQSARQLSYYYDVFGNVLSQGNGQTTETYTYDPLFRLSTANRTGAAPGSVNYAYDAVGNFLTKSDFSNPNGYAYVPGTNKLATVTAPAKSFTYTYDANGNLTGDGAGFTARYDLDNRPINVQRGGWTLIGYGPDGERISENSSDGLRLYAGSYEKWQSTGEQKAYLGDYAVVTTSSTGRRVDYLLKDRLGSVDAVAGSDGVLKETRGYDAFGKPRQGNWADAAPPVLSPTAASNTLKGFTEHEHLNAVQLIHMGGRAYDYNLGKFLSVDPIIQFPLNSQSLNPYSYILNNPLSGTDPTGYASAPECAKNNSCPDIEFDKVAPAGSHIKSETKVSGKTGDGGSFSFTIDRATGSVTSSFFQTGNGAEAQTSKGTAMCANPGHVDSSSIGAASNSTTTGTIGPSPELGWFKAGMNFWTGDLAGLVNGGLNPYTNLLLTAQEKEGAKFSILMMALPAEGALARGAAPLKRIVIGEGMDAIKDAARGLGAKWYQAWSKNFPKDRLMTSEEFAKALQRNDRWIKDKIKKGYEIFDLGIDPARRARSPFYELEKNVLQERNYPTTPIPRE